MLNKVFAVAVGMAVFSSAPANANMLDACAWDIEDYCPYVKPGNGRVSACLYANETVVSDECYAAITEVSLLLDTYFQLVRSTAEACQEDAIEHCADVPAGRGAKFGCLKANKASLSEGCSAKLDKLGVE